MAADHGQREAFRDPPFALYGLSDLLPRTIASNYDGATLSLACLGHGTREDPDLPWVEVIVHGPLHGTVPDGPLVSNATWEEDPETLPLFHVVVSNDPHIDGNAVPAAEAALAKQWTAVQLIVDGTPQTFQFVRQGRHWGAIRRIEPDHAIAICASNIEPDDVVLQQIRDLRPYFEGTSTS